MSLKFGLKPEHVNKILSVFGEYPQIKRVLIYGSRAKGNYREGSDIDLTLEAPELELTDLLKIENELDDLMLPYKIDLSLFHTLENQSLIEHIQRVGTDFSL